MKMTVVVAQDIRNNEQISVTVWNTNDERMYVGFTNDCFVARNLAEAFIEGWEAASGEKAKVTWEIC